MTDTIDVLTNNESYLIDIDDLLDDYINTLDSIDLMYEPLIFKGCLKYIYINLFKIKENDIKYNNKSSTLDYSDINTLVMLWDKYTSMCYRYMQIPLLTSFSILTGLSIDTMCDWQNGTNRLSSGHSQLVKSWKNECESALETAVLSRNIKNPAGYIFSLKARYGWIETAPQQVIQHVHTRGIDQIAAEHKPEIVDMSTEKADF